MRWINEMGYYQLRVDIDLFIALIDHSIIDPINKQLTFFDVGTGSRLEVGILSSITKDKIERVIEKLLVGNFNRRKISLPSKR